MFAMSVVVQGDSPTATANRYRVHLETTLSGIVISFIYSLTLQDVITKDSNTSRHHKEARPASDFQCLRHVRSGSDCRVQGECSGAVGSQ